MKPIVTLTWAEVRLAVEVGTLREITDRKAGRVSTNGADPDEGWNRHVEGAAGEMAAAKYLGLYWSGNFGRLKADDVGTLQVRQANKDLSLLLQKTDDPKKRFILVTGTLPIFKICGWILAEHGQQKQYWRDPVGGRPCYFVPQSILHAIESLIL